ncbi:MAG: SDR family NAD(P)-dependent oxidoreductase [Deltaproteobacteria bacterium]|nr:SDR family NAD(P)-dependent oxidoreductase [Deltaproteobacteria bacterium]
MQGARCFVTGAAGFIGSSLVRVLANSGADVVAFDNLATGHAENLAGVREETGREARFIHGDVRDREKLARVLPGADLVFHLACLGVRHSLHSPFENLDVNARGTLSVLAQARAAKVKRVVHTSSSEVYGTAKHVPMSEEHATDPHTVYGASKLDGECCARAYWRCYQTPVVVVRPFNAYGPRSHSEGDSGEVIPRFLVRALVGKAPVIFGDGSQTRDFTHVYDSAAALVRAAVTPNIEGETFNVGAGREIRIDELARIVVRAVGRPELSAEHIEPRPGDVLRLFADSSKAARLLAHQSSVAMADGIADLATRLRALGDDAVRALDANIVVRSWA